MSIPISGQLVPGASTIALVDSVHVKGGMATFATTTERDAVPDSRRRRGMLAYCADTDSVYKLGADLDTWTLFFVGGGSVTYRTNGVGDGRVTTPHVRKVKTIGDSLSYNTFTGELEDDLQLVDPAWTCDYLAVGGDTAPMCRERLQGGVWHSPIRGVDSLVSGANDLFIKPYMPPLNDSDSDSSFELGRRRGGCPNPQRAVIYNRGEYAATATERRFIARCSGTSQAILYESVANDHAIVNAGNETAVMTTGVLNATMTRSTTVGSAEGLGAASARFVCTSTVGFHGMYESVDADSIYEVEAWVYIPTASAISGSVGIGADGASATYLATTTAATTTVKDAWTKIQVLIYIPSDGTVISIGSATGVSEENKIFYLDRVAIRKRYIPVTDHKLTENFPCWLENITYDPHVYMPLVTVPTGWKEHKNSYVRLVSGSTTTIELSLTSGGSQDTYTGTGWAFVHCGMQATYTWTPTGGDPGDPDDPDDFAFTWEADYLDMGAVWVVWIGANSSLGDEALVRAEIKRIASMCRSGRLIVLTPLINSSGTLGSLGRDFGNDLRDWIAQEFPDQYIDANLALMNANDGSAQDLTDVGNDVHPTSLRSEAIHLNAAGYSVIAEAVFEKMVSLGYV